jgi:hypothetical protein
MRFSRLLKDKQVIKNVKWTFGRVEKYKLILNYIGKSNFVPVLKVETSIQIVEDNKAFTRFLGGKYLHSYHCHNNY